MKVGVICILPITFLLISCNQNFLHKSDYPDKAAYLLCSVRDSKLPFSNAQRFGFFSSNLWQHYQENLKSEIAVFGAVPGYVLWYLQMGDDFPIEIAEHNKKMGIYTVINQDISSTSFSPEENEILLKEIVDGKWDDFFRRFASQAQSMDTKVYYRFGYEMNGDWFPWGQKERLFVNAWRHTRKLFKKENADSVFWIFSPSIVWGKRTFDDDIRPYYPGDDYVDIVALDGYNFGDNHDNYHQWESFNEVFAGSIAGLMSFGKPMWIAEIGCPSEPRRRQWLRDFLEFFDTNGCFEVFFWFNENKVGEPNFRIDGDDESLAIFREWAQRINSRTGPADELAKNSGP